MIDERRHRAAVLGELAGLRLWLAEVRAGAIRRAAELSQRSQECQPGRPRAALAAVAREVLVVGEAAENALGGLEGDLAEFLAGPSVQERGVRGRGRPEES